MVKIFNANQAKEAAEYLVKTQSYFMFRTADFKSVWTKWHFSPEKVISWDVKAYEEYITLFMNVNSQYGHTLDSFRVVCKPVRWFIENGFGEREYYDTLDEMIFLEGGDGWDVIKHAKYEVLDYEPQHIQREYSLDELAEEL